MLSYVDAQSRFHIYRIKVSKPIEGIDQLSFKERVEMDDNFVEGQKQFIPNNFLPTFNSCTIEMFIGNIKGLSEYFIYGNDDMFFVNYCNHEIQVVHVVLLSDLIQNSFFLFS